MDDPLAMKHCYKPCSCVEGRFSVRNFDAVYDHSNDFVGEDLHQYIDRELLKDRLVQVPPLSQ